MMFRAPAIVVGITSATLVAKVAVVAVCMMPDIPVWSLADQLCHERTRHDYSRTSQRLAKSFFFLGDVFDNHGLESVLAILAPKVFR